MAGPSVRSAATSVTNPASATHGVLMPPTVVAGDILLMLYMDDGSGAITVSSIPTGWSSDLADSGTMRLFVSIKEADGTEGGTTVNWTGGNDESAHIVYAIKNADLNTPIERAFTTNTNNPPSLTPVNWNGASEDWLAITYLNNATTNSPFTCPSGYSNTQSAGIASVFGCSSAEKAISGSASEDPGTWGTSSGTSAGAITLGIRGRRAGTVVSPQPIPLAGVYDSSTSGGVDPRIPFGCMVDDVAFCFVESNGVTISIANWTLMGSAQAYTGGDVQVWWKRLTHANVQAALTAAVGPTTGNHRGARILVFRGCKTSGDPWEGFAQSAENTSDTSCSTNGLTTTDVGRLVISAVGHGLDAGSNQLSSWANSDLSLIREIADDSTTQGNGGGVGVVCGEKAVAGTVGATTATLLAASEKALFDFALIPRTLAALASTWKPKILVYR